jgi:hypothetical protein
MTQAPSVLRSAGALTGLALAALLVFALRVPAADTPLGAGVRMSAVPPGELAVPVKPFLSARGLVAGGGAARGRLVLRNVAPAPVQVRLRARGAGGELGPTLWVELHAGDRLLHSGTLAALRRRTRPFRIAEGGAARIRVSVRVPADATDYEGRDADVSLLAHVRRAR